MFFSSKAQVWYADFVVGVLIFSIVITTFFYYAEHDRPYSDENLVNFLATESDSVSSYLLSEGYPVNWTISNVSIIGLTNGDYRINTSKLDSFNSWDYDELADYLKTSKDYYFYFEYMNNTKFNEICVDPEAGCIFWNTSRYLVQNTHIVIVNSTIVRMVFILYQNP